MPYATAVYSVTRRRRVYERDLYILRGGRSELLRVQTSTIPASHSRLIVEARPQSLVAAR